MRRFGQDAARWAIPVALAALAALGLWQAHREGHRLRTYVRRPVGVMGTDCELQAVAPGSGADQAERALSAAEGALRDVDAHMSVYLDLSELSGFNRALARQVAELSPMTMEVLRAARDFAAPTDGAFDVTCRPLLQLWKRCGKEGRLPTREELAGARDLVGWKNVELLERGARKHKDGVEIDLGGIAKKYAIDRAVAAMQTAGVPGGMVNVGGDIRCFGRKPDGTDWQIGIRDPFRPGGPVLLGTVRIAQGSVCTSGNYERFVEIGGRRYSHIVDPRTGQPADTVPSVTVVGPDALTAGVWATALSVLGPDGLKRLPAGLEALLVTGTPAKFEVHRSAGFASLLAGPLNPSLPIATQPRAD